MRGLVTDRTQYNVSRRASLSAKGWLSMSSSEKEEWVGNPINAQEVNLLPRGPYYSSTVTLTYKNRAITATAISAGVYLYAESIIGEAKNYENKTFTLSVDGMESEGGGIPQIALYWHDDAGAGFDYAGVSMFSAGSVTFNTSDWPNANNRKYLALYVYVTTSASVSPGATSSFVGVMLENGNTRHEYVPYTEILPTATTRGAYNFADLNRVERAVEEISDIEGLGLVVKTDWAMWDIPTKSDMARYLSNIKLIRDRYDSDIVLPDTMDNLTYETANNIEKILVVAYEKATVG